MQIIDEVYHQRGMVKKERKKKSEKQQANTSVANLFIDVKIK